MRTTPRGVMFPDFPNWAGPSNNCPRLKEAHLETAENIVRSFFLFFLKSNSKVSCCDLPLSVIASSNHV